MTGTRFGLMAATALALAGSAMATPAAGQDNAVRSALDVQRARDALVPQMQARKYYEAGRFKLDDLPGYVPREQVSGPLRIWTSDMWGGPDFAQRMAAAFARFQPGIRIEFVSTTPGGTFAGLLTGSADIAVARRMMWVDLLGYQRKFKRDPLVIEAMTGWHVNPPYAISVSKDNPLRELSMEQLDGIFGSERNGGWKGTTWDPDVARGPEKNIRTWGQLGLKGEWADKPINVYGYNLQYLFAPRFSDDVLKGSGKWNERLRQFTIYADTSGKLVSVDQQMADAVAKDRYSIAYYSPNRGISPATRFVPLRTASGALVPLTLDSVRDHSYPLFDNMWFYANRTPAGGVEPRVREFLSFILSREAQQLVADDTTMLPLTAALAAKQRQMLE